MTAKYKITETQKAEIERARNKNRDKIVENRLKALSMRADGAKANEISEATGYHPSYLSTLVSKGDSSVGSLSSHPGIPLYLWSC